MALGIYDTTTKVARSAIIWLILELMGDRHTSAFEQIHGCRKTSSMQNSIGGSKRMDRGA